MEPECQECICAGVCRLFGGPELYLPIFKVFNLVYLRELEQLFRMKRSFVSRDPKGQKERCRVVKVEMLIWQEVTRLFTVSLVRVTAS